MGFLDGIADIIDEEEEYKKDKQNIKRLYLFEITFESGMKVVKIGKASGRSSVDRMMQIQRDFFNKCRTTFLCRIRRDRPIDKDLVFKYEAEMHKFFREYQYKAPVEFDGHTECFAIPIEDAIKVYEYLEAGNSLENEPAYQLPYQRGEIEDKDELPF